MISYGGEQFFFHARILKLNCSDCRACQYLCEIQNRCFASIKVYTCDLHPRSKVVKFRRALCKRLSTSPLWTILKSLLRRKPASPPAKYSDTRSPRPPNLKRKKTRSVHIRDPFTAHFVPGHSVNRSLFNFHARLAGSLRQKRRRFQVLKFPVGIAGALASPLFPFRFSGRFDARSFSPAAHPL